MAALLPVNVQVNIPHTIREELLKSLDHPGRNLFQKVSATAHWPSPAPGKICHRLSRRIGG